MGFVVEKSNSAKILDLVFENKIEAVIGERVLKEVKRYFREKRGRNFSYIIELLLRRNCTIIKGHEVKETMLKLRGQIKEKDLEQLSIVKKLNLRYLIGYDRDHEKFTEYFTPKRFLEKLNQKTFETEY